MRRSPVLFAVLAFTASVHAQELSTRATQRAFRAAVKITARSPMGEATGSGSIIDPRGYVLTNFHVVGHVEPGDGTPGTLFDPSNRVELAMVDSDRDAARTRYFGR